jgi:hypothetical protein
MRKKWKQVLNLKYRLTQSLNQSNRRNWSLKGKIYKRDLPKRKQQKLVGLEEKD